MYDLVYAVNQQYPKRKEGNAGGLLILTKFAELVVDSNHPRLAVSNKRFQAMTRMTRNTVKKHLKELEAANFLIPLDDPNTKHTGDSPILYELQLPEGFNRKEVMQRHYNMYYGGEYLEPNKINLKIDKGKMLPPVSAEVVAYTEASEIDKPMSEIDKDASKFDKEVSKIDPYNNIKNIKNNNNKPNVSADAVDDDFLKKYCEDTKLSSAFFKEHGITKENVNLLDDCITKWKDKIAKGMVRCKNKAKYLIPIIKNAVKNAPQHEHTSPTFEEVQQKIRKKQERVAKQNANYIDPEEVTSATEKIIKSALDKFKITFTEEQISNLKRYLSANPIIITQVVDDFEKNCDLSNKSGNAATDWVCDYVLDRINQPPQAQK